MKQLFFRLCAVVFLFLSACKQEKEAPPSPQFSVAVPQVTEAYFVYKNATGQQVIEPIVYYGDVTSANGDVDFGLVIGATRGVCPTDLKKIQDQNAKFKGSNLTAKTWGVSPLKVRNCK